MENVNNKEKNLLEEFEKIQSNPISHAIFWSQVLKTKGSNESQLKLFFLILINNIIRLSNLIVLVLLIGLIFRYIGKLFI